MATNQDEHSLTRGTLVSQYKVKHDKRGHPHRCGPYMIIVFRTFKDYQEWIYLGKEGSERYQSRLGLARAIMTEMPAASNAEIVTAIRFRMKTGDWFQGRKHVVPKIDWDDEEETDLSDPIE